MGNYHIVYTWTYCSQYYYRTDYSIFKITFNALNSSNNKGKQVGSINPFHLLFSLR